MEKLNIEDTLFCGQTFSWHKEDDRYVAMLDDRRIEIRDEKDILDDEYLNGYFDMDYDYAEARKFLSMNFPILKNAIEDIGNIHILKQDHWITCASFILSQNNNIKRITGLYDRMCAKWGGGFFPGPDRLLNVTEDDYRSLGLGFRASYMVDAVKKSHILDEIEGLDYAQADERLRSIKGIGPKVSACILLFSYHHMNAFPMDVWMKRVMKEYFEGRTGEIFAPYASIAQQYLFHYARLGKIC